MEQAKWLGLLKRSLTFTAVLALSITLRPILTTGQPGAEPQSAANSDWPSPTPTESRTVKQSQSENENDKAGMAQNASPSPPTVQVVTEIGDNGGKQKHEKSSTDWWLVIFTGVLAGASIIQLVIYGKQATRLRETIEKMDEISSDQHEDMGRYIEQAKRSADEMVKVAASLAISADSVVQSVAISREIADRQKLISEVSGRAYLSVEHFAVSPQSNATGYKFEPRASLFNRGSTPAYNVKFVVTADVIPFPIPADFNFPLGEINEAGRGVIIASTLHKVMQAPVPRLYDDDEIRNFKAGLGKRLAMWGKVIYKDVFGTDHHIEFGFTYMWMEDGKTTWSYDIPGRTSSD